MKIYSYRKDSIGLLAAAFRAGYNPKINPTAEETIIPKIAAVHRLTDANSLTYLFIFSISVQL
ncbi:MAG: hypothetical protein AAB471_00575, partial [Patescibacteria group bacterium]